MSKNKGTNTKPVPTNGATISANVGNYLDDKNSFVKKDRLWRSHIEQMVAKDKFWVQQWGFMSDRSNLPSSRKQLAMDARLKEEKRNETNASKCVPKTTAQMIGWRSTDETCKLEKYGRYTKAKQSILRSLNWPPEGVG